MEVCSQLVEHAPGDVLDGYVAACGGEIGRLALADRGELDRAHEHANRALELSRDHGYGAFQPRAAAIMASHAAMEA
jgi:hypothetical protein